MERVLAWRMGEAGQRQSGEDNAPTEEHIIHTDMSLAGRTVSAPLLFECKNSVCL